MNIIVIFIILSLANVIGSTIRTLVTIKADNPIVAAVVNAAYFAFYNIVMIYTVADFSLLIKCAITFGCNLIGVFVVKYGEHRSRPPKMWKVEMAVKTDTPETIEQELSTWGVSCNYIVTNDWIMFNCYCDTREQSCYVNKVCKRLNGKISAYERKAF